MNSNVAGWLAVISAGASGASAAILSTSGPVDKRMVVVAVLAFFIGAGSAAKAFLQPAPQSKQ